MAGARPWPMGGGGRVEVGCGLRALVAQCSPCRPTRPAGCVWMPLPAERRLRTISAHTSGAAEPTATVTWHAGAPRPAAL
eukprot:COSAG04_NODE_10354_length_784_cov_1.138686_1_plen_79_part_10